MTSRLVVLGGCGAWPEAGRACSGFVLEHEGVRVVLDLGYGTLPPLLRLLGSTVADGIDAVVITHRHPDHMIDLHGLFRARWFGSRDAAAIPVYAGAGVRERLRGLEEDDADVVDRSSTGTPCPAARTPSGRSGWRAGRCRTSCRTPAYGCPPTGSPWRTPATPDRTRPRRARA